MAHIRLKGNHMKACKNCFSSIKYDSNGDLLDSYQWRCSQIWNNDAVTGEPYFQLCHVERVRLDAEFVPCGNLGKLFVDRKEREREINADQFRKSMRHLNDRPDD
jgi:hypothetical protein